ncbi:Uncharacterised protein [Acinetobacter baumannii]|nr:Uncharacterised protein [Acinetobacter baumannii]SSS12940.1 Uncharacterised protein [Acinetobacter baumannii]
MASTWPLLNFFTKSVISDGIGCAPTLSTIIFWAASYCKIANLVPRTFSIELRLLSLTNK